jgi:RNA-binding protein
VNSEELKLMIGKAHALQPVIMIGQAGLTDPVLNEIDLALKTHELIKIKVRAERDERKLIQEAIITATSAELIQSIGQVVVIYRKKPAVEPKKKKQGSRRRDF